MKKNGEKRRFVVRFEVGVTVFILFIIITTSLLIYFPWHFTSKKNINYIVDQVNLNVNQEVSKEIDNLFSTSTVALLNLKSMFERNVVDINDPDERENLYYTFLRNNPNFSWIVFGWTNGDFLGAQREMVDGKEALSIVNRKWEGPEKKATKTIDFYSPDGNEKVRRVIHNENYKSTTRAWYKVGAEKRNHAWTGVYIFRTTKNLGINVSVSLEQNNQFIGVISIAMELDNISKYLKKIRVGKTGTVFLINSKLELIASKDLDEVLFDIENDKPVLRKISNTKSHFARLANNVLTEKNIKRSDLKTINEFVYKDPHTKQSYFVCFSLINYLDWTVGTVIPEKDFLQEIDSNKKKLFVIIVLFSLANSLILLFFSKRIIVNPIAKINDQTKEIESFRLENIHRIDSHIKEINQLSSSMLNMSKGLSAFKKYLPVEIVRSLIEEKIDVSLGGEEKSITIFFSDIESFTTHFERLGIKMVPFLCDYLEEMSKIIMDNQGAIDKYIGDAIMAFWGAPVANPTHAEDACRSALGCQRVLKMLRMNWDREDKPQFHTRIGINTGVVLVGNIGYTERFNYTVIGDPVNIASRLESLNKYYGTGIIIGKNTYEEAKQQIIARKIDVVRSYGANNPLEIFELIQMKEDMSVTEHFDWINTYETAWKLYSERNWKDAHKLFDKTIRMRGGQDGPSALFREKCRELMSNPPQNDWDGITRMDTK